MEAHIAMISYDVNINLFICLYQQTFWKNNLLQI